MSQKDVVVDATPYRCTKCGHKMTYEEYLTKGCRICKLEGKNGT